MRWLKIRSINILKNFITLSAVQVLNYIVPIITMPILIRILGVELYGQYTFLYSLISYCLLFVNFGFDTFGIREVANSRDNIDLLSNILSSVFWSKLFILIFTGFVLFCLRGFFFTKEDDFFLVLVIYLGVFGQIITPNWFFVGLGKSSYILASMIISQIVNLALILTFINDKEDYWIVFVVNTCSLLIAGFIQSFILLYKYKIEIRPIVLKNLITQFKHGLPFFTSTIGIHLYKNNAVQFLKYNNFTYDVGVFAILRKLFEALNSFNSVLSQAFISETMQRHERSRFNPVIKKLFWISLLSTIFISTVVFFNAAYISYLISGSENRDIIKGLQLMIFSLVIVGINVPCVHFLISEGREKYISYTALLGFLIDFICLLFFVPIFGFIGAIYSVLITETTTTFALYLIVFFVVRKR